MKFIDFCLIILFCLGSAFTLIGGFFSLLFIVPLDIKDDRNIKKTVNIGFFIGIGLLIIGFILFPYATK